MHPVENIRISPWPVDVVEFGDDAYAHRKQVYVRQLYNQLPQTAWVSSSSISSWGQDAHVRASDPRLSSPARIRKKYCYGQKNLGSICSSLSPSPTHLSHTRNITHSRIKCGRYIFIKKCVRSFIEVRHYVWLYSACIMHMYVAIQHFD